LCCASSAESTGAACSKNKAGSTILHLNVQASCVMHGNVSQLLFLVMRMSKHIDGGKLAGCSM
jgi:hypothetical protein